MDDVRDSAPRAWSRSADGERRVIGRALERWDALRTPDALPDRRACLAAFDDGLADAVVLIQITRRLEDDRIEACGEALRRAVGADPVGRYVRDVLPSCVDRGLVFWRVAAEMRKPVADIGRFTNRAGDEIEYRSLFLPISDDGVRVTHLIGAFSYRDLH